MEGSHSAGRIEAAFAMLGATPRDSKERLAERVDALNLAADPEAVSRAWAVLIHPRRRVAAELAWLPGLEPDRATEYRSLIDRTPIAVLSLVGLPPLAMANLLADALAGGGLPADAGAACLIALATQVDAVDVEQLQRELNGDRSLAGMSPIPSPAWVSAELGERIATLRRTAMEYLQGLPAERMLAVVTEIVKRATDDGNRHAPRLIEDWAAEFELGSMPAFEAAYRSFRSLREEARAGAGFDTDQLAPILADIDAAVAMWCRLALPAQLCAKSRGQEHAASNRFAVEIRELGTELANRLNLHAVNARLNAMITERFAAVPSVLERAAADAAGIASRRIEYEESVRSRVVIGRTILATSPDGIEWRGRCYPFGRITRIRYGGRRATFGAVYVVGWSSAGDEVTIKFRRLKTWSPFADALWRAIGARLIWQYAKALKQGYRYRFGDMVLADEGVDVPLYRLFRKTQRLFVPWCSMRCHSHEGMFMVTSTTNGKAQGRARYHDTDNLQAMTSIVYAMVNRRAEKVSGVYHA